MKRGGRLCQEQRPQCASVQKSSLTALRPSSAHRPGDPGFKPHSFCRHVNIAKILLRERRNRAVRFELRDRRVQALLQRIVTLANPERDTAAQDLVVADRSADKAITRAVRLRQEAALSG